VRLHNWALVFIVFALAATVVLPRYVTGQMRPDAFIIMIVFISVRAPHKQALALCWATGLARDIISGGPLGAYALIYLASGFVIMRARTTTNLSMAPTRAVVGFFAAFLAEWLHAAATGRSTGLWPTAGATNLLLTASLMTGICTAFCAWILDRNGKWLGIRGRHGFTRN